MTQGKLITPAGLGLAVLFFSSVLHAETFRFDPPTVALTSPELKGKSLEDLYVILLFSAKEYCQQKSCIDPASKQIGRCNNAVSVGLSVVSDRSQKVEVDINGIRGDCDLLINSVECALQKPFKMYPELHGDLMKVFQGFFGPEISAPAPCQGDLSQAEGKPLEAILKLGVNLSVVLNQLNQADAPSHFLDQHPVPLHRRYRLYRTFAQKSEYQQARFIAESGFKKREAIVGLEGQWITQEIAEIAKLHAEVASWPKISSKTESLEYFHEVGMLRLDVTGKVPLRYVEVRVDDFYYQLLHKSLVGISTTGPFEITEEHLKKIEKEFKVHFPHARLSE